MEYQVDADDKQKLLVVTTSGDACFDTFRHMIDQLVSPPFADLDYDVIIDNRNLDLKTLLPEEAQSLADLLAQQMDTAHNIKHALVAGNVLSFGISRLFELRASSIQNLPMRVFLSYEEALSWIREPE
jgi:hypothetical protein